MLKFIFCFSLKGVPSFAALTPQDYKIRLMKNQSVSHPVNLLKTDY